MHPILRIINYIFEKNNQVCTGDTYDSFFDNGIAFPRFIEILFNVKIPEIVQNPSNIEQKKKNNVLALNFLYNQNEDISKESPKFDTEKDKESLLSLILTKQCFKINHKAIISKCNMIIKPLNYQIKNKSNLLNSKTILMLLNILTKGKVSIDTENKDFDEIMIKSFETAKVPLVIDKTSIEPQYQFTFYIQILIIFDHFQSDIKQIYKHKKHEKQKKEQEKNKLINFENTDISTSIVEDYFIENDYSDSDKTKTKTKKHHISEIEKEKKNDEALLKTINALGSIKNLQFNTLVQAAERDNIIKFSMIFFQQNESDKSFLSNLVNQIKPYTEKIHDFLIFLSQKEPIFSTLALNFNNPDLKKTTSSLFYTRFLECFFIKRSKKEMFERCKTLLFTKIEKNDTLYPLYCEIVEKPKHLKKILFNWDVYLALIYFVNNGKIHFNKSKSNTVDYSFLVKRIPQIIDENYLKINKKDLSPIYFQLQFIFNEIDKSGFKHYFVETFLKSMRKLSLVNVPKFDRIAADIIPKNIALIEQNRRYREFSSTDKNDNDDISNDEKQEETQNKEIVEPDTFEIRQYKKTIKYKEEFKLKLKRHPSLKFKPSEEFWDSNDNEYSFENGVLFQSINDKIDVYNKTIENIEKTYQFTPSSNFLVTPKSEVRFDEIPPQNVKSKLYKFFVYNEMMKKWEKNSSSINQFSKDMLFDKLKIETLLIFVSNSYEKEIITLNSKLIQCLCPDLDDDQIYVYAVNGKSLSFLKYKVDLLQNDNSKKPIFLVLHVPESKMKLKNIKTIVYQINYFLSIICDIEMVILNKEHYIDQIGFIEDINDIKHSYDSSIEKHFQLRNQPSSKSKDHHFQIEDDIEINQGSDDDLFIDEEEDINDIHNDIFARMNLDIFRKQRNFVFLVNSELIHGDYERPLDNDFILNIKEHFNKENCHAHFINITDTCTYREFLTTLNSISMKIKNNNEEVFERFDFFEISNVSGIYFELKKSKQRKTKLEEIIRKRFLEFKEFNENQLNDFDILSNLHKEIATTYPSIDDDYNDEINKIIAAVQKEISQTSKSIFLTEIDESSKNNLLYLTEVIDSQDYWSPEKRTNIKNNHENFLKEEFFSIINNLFPVRNHSMVFEANYSILESQIEEDRGLIDKLFQIFDDKKIKQSNKNIIDIYDQRKRGTNYMIRERENIREIKVIVESGNVDDEIERDF